LFFQVAEGPTGLSPPSFARCRRFPSPDPVFFRTSPHDELLFSEDCPSYDLFPPSGRRMFGSGSRLFGYFGCRPHVVARWAPSLSCLLPSCPRLYGMFPLKYACRGRSLSSFYLCCPSKLRPAPADVNSSFSGLSLPLSRRSKGNLTFFFYLLLSWRH